MVFLSAGKTIIFILILLIILGFLIFDSTILKSLVRKVNAIETRSELYDDDIPTSNKIFTYKLTQTNNYKRQDNIKKARVGSFLVIKEVKKDRQSYLSVQCNDKEIGVITKKYLETVAPDFLEGVKYEFRLSKIEIVNEHYYAYIKLYKSDATADDQFFDKSAILKQIDYRVGDEVMSKEFGKGVVVEIRMHSVVVKFEKGIKIINDYKSLKLIKK
jgi:hypothetical protein